MKLFSLMLTVFMISVPAWASPPRELTAVYDVVSGVLDVSMKHPTTEPRDHYIRTIRVTVNDGEPQIFRYTFQRLASEFSAAIPLALKPGDRVVVRAECRLGGNAETELLIPEPEVPQESEAPEPELP